MRGIGMMLACGAVLAAGTAGAGPKHAPKPIRVLLVLGGCCHEYSKQMDVLKKGLTERANVTVTIAYDPDTGTSHLNPVYQAEDWSKEFDVVIHDECTSDLKDTSLIERILAPHKKGLPAVILHCGEHSYRSEGWPKSTPWFDLTGCASTGHGPQAPIAISFLGTDSPITKGMQDWTTVNEELYNNSAGKPLDTATPLARGKQTFTNSTAESVVIWTNKYAGNTRVFATTLGHNTATVEDPRYLDLVTRGLLWAVNKLDKDGKPKAGYGPAK